jgi:prophage regulatory protein
MNTAAPEAPIKPRIMRRAEVRQRTGLPFSTLYLYVRRGEFPKPIKLGDGGSMGWLEHEVDAWVAEQIAKTRGNPDAA